MNATELIDAIASASVYPNTAQAVKLIGDLLGKIERQRKHLTHLERSRMSQRRKIRRLRSALAGLVKQVAPRQAATQGHLHHGPANKDLVAITLGDPVVTTGGCFALGNAFETLGLKDTLPQTQFDLRVNEIIERG